MFILNFLYFHVLNVICYIVFSFFKVEHEGLENIPENENFIIAANHCCFLDAPFIAWIFRKKYMKPISWVVSRAIYYQWWAWPACKISQSVPVGGGVVKEAQKIILESNSVGIFPQGGIRCCHISIEKARTGVALLALKTGAKVLPCYIDGDFDRSKMFNYTPRFFGKYKIIIGKPLSFKKIDTLKISRDLLEESLSQVMQTINSLRKDKEDDQGVICK